MMKTLSVSTALLVFATTTTGCATTSPDAYLGEDCKDLRSLIQAQDQAASVRSVESVSDRRLEELEHTSGSPWAGRPRTQDDRKLQDERQSIRDAYRRKGCKA